MKARCYNQNDANYRKYGARGVAVCDRWLDKTRVQVGEYTGGMGQTMPKQWPLGYLNFIADMGERPLGKTLDREDNSGDYTPENCRWATLHQQAANKSNNNETVGVSYDTHSGLWEGYLVIDKKRVFRKRSKDKSAVIAARKAAEIEFNL